MPDCCSEIPRPFFFSTMGVCLKSPAEPMHTLAAEEWIGPAGDAIQQISPVEDSFFRFSLPYIRTALQWPTGQSLAPVLSDSNDTRAQFFRKKQPKPLQTSAAFRKGVPRPFAP
jgi:hypothetical protein